MSNGQYLAILDLGSNSVRLKITKFKITGALKRFNMKKDTFVLLPNMGARKMLKSTPVKRTIDALKEFQGNL